MSYSEDRADSRSLTAVALILLGIAFVGLILYFALWVPRGNDTVIVTPTMQGPAGEPGAPGMSGAPGMNGAPGMSGAQGIEGASGAQGESGAAGAAGAAGATGAAGTAGGTTGQ